MCAGSSDTRPCRACGRTPDEVTFGERRFRGKLYRRSYCNECRRDAAREHRHTAREDDPTAASRGYCRDGRRGLWL